MTTRICIAIAAATLFIASACKKEETTTPTDGTKTDEVEAEDEEEEDEPADEEEREAEAEPLSKHSFHETIDEHMSEVTDCYLKLLETNPDAKGKLEADFTFGADGVPTGVVAGAGSSLNDESLVMCIAEVSKFWGFGVPKEAGMTLRYSFHLAPAG